ncbi:Copper-exporting P-type ATPase B [Candidatus Tiddalikarchaeum anstoanum]|nr:Copper-exporting P-type ATPase B [Candidatus Tiddalikarchaeum anstoanum]
MVSTELLNKGLTNSEVNEKRKRFGFNKLPEKSGKSAFTIFISQFKSPLIYIISIAALVSILLEEYSDAVIIIIVILFDVIIGFAQEYKAEKTMEALKHLLNPMARVIRNNNVINIEVSEIVPGDLVILNTGERIPADGELIEAVSLGLNEAILTGESEPIIKNIKDTVSMGTIILSGRGLMKVTGTGLKTKLGKIASSLVEIKEELTPLQVRLNAFGKTLTYIVVIISALIFITGIIFGKDVFEMIRLSIVLAIAAIPEGLLIAVTMILAIGMRMILKKKGLVKKLLAVETLGSVTTIATDKTGTLTEGQMKVVKVDLTNTKIAGYVMALCNNLEDSLEITLWDYVKKSLGIDPQKLVNEYKRVEEIPFTSEKKYMLTSNNIEGSELFLIKGAPDILLDFCNLSISEKKKIVDKINTWASEGLKLIGLAYKKSEKKIGKLSGYDWVGLVGIEDPIRPTVKKSIQLCNGAGIKTKIITGDYRITAINVAKGLGLPVSEGHVLEGFEIDKMSEKELTNIVKDVTVFCRVTPQHKLKIVTALQNAGEVTAMIGDGVNDAPALKKANIGVTVGTATDVAQETSSLIMLDSNFQTIVDAVEEGRIIFDNIKKVAAYVLSDSFAEILVVFFAFLFGWPAPLTVAQILWIHLICDGPSDIALGFERGERGIMNEPPKSIKKSNILDKSSIFLIIAISLASAVLSLLLFNYMWGYFKFFGNEGRGIALGRTIVFTAIAIQDMIYIYSYKSLRHSVFKTNIFSNKWLNLTVLLGIGQQLLAIYVPPFNTMLGTVPLNFFEWVLVLLVGFSMMMIVEIVKFIINRMHLRNGNPTEILKKNN